MLIKESRLRGAGSLGKLPFAMYCVYACQRIAKTMARSTEESPNYLLLNSRDACPNFEDNINNAICNPNNGFCGLNLESHCLFNQGVHKCKSMVFKWLCCFIQSMFQEFILQLLKTCLVAPHTLPILRDHTKVHIHLGPHFE